MINEQIANELNVHLQRIFCLPITRSTFRDLQQVVLHLTQGDPDRSNQFFELLLSGTIKESIVDKGAYEKVRLMVENYTIPCRMSKEVFERGDFLAGASSEMLVREDQAAFVNRIRRVDGKELQFIADPQGVFFLIHHFVSRLEELKRDGKLKGNKDEIGELRSRLQSLLIEESIP
jgi:hypothetical protein